MRRPSLAAVAGLDVPAALVAAQQVGLDHARRELVARARVVADPHQPLLADALVEGGHGRLLVAGLVRLRRVGQGVLPERAGDLVAHGLQRAVGLGGDHRRDHVQRPQERLCLQRRQPRRAAEGVAVELLVDQDRAVLGRAVDGVAAAAEVDQVEQVEVLLQLLLGEVEAARARRPMATVAEASSPQRSSRNASSACSSANRSGATGPCVRGPAAGRSSTSARPRGGCGRLRWARPCAAPITRRGRSRTICDQLRRARAAACGPSSSSTACDSGLEVGVLGGERGGAVVVLLEARRGRRTAGSTSQVSSADTASRAPPAGLAAPAATAAGRGRR